jgi:ATP-binding cassette, subfamily B, bacterial HlyB/CyaB
MFNKVLALPLDYFERSSTGVITRDMNEMFKIRTFLTGQLFGTVLDSFVLLVFLPIMFFFSPILTGVVLAFCGLICLAIIWMLPVLRRKASATFSAEGAKNAFLVETLQGIRTVKSLALDARQRHEWDVRVATAARLRLDELRTANLIQTVVTPLERLMVSGVMALAVYFAISTNDQLYVGALVAFMMLTQRVAAPLVQLSHLLQQYDDRGPMHLEARQPARRGRPLAGRHPHPARRAHRVQGRAVSLSRCDGTGARWGIVHGAGGNRSRHYGTQRVGQDRRYPLLQMLHSNYEGLIKIDGNDLREFDVDHLRSSLGVVLQDNFLFSGTIREAIAAAKPDASFEEIVYAARLAGAEEFIENLPRGYETHIQEGSSNLSGGQRQRLAIARALLGDPRILILDEATSALDAESEAIVNANLMRIAKGRTLVIISHRLSVLVKADTVLVLERGRVYDAGRHAELLERCDIYRGLWYQQNQHLQPRPTHGLVALRAGTAA